MNSYKVHLDFQVLYVYRTLQNAQVTALQLITD